MQIFEKYWRKLIKDVISEGKLVKKDDSEVIEKLGNHVFIPTPYLVFPHLASSKHFGEQIRIGLFDIDEYPLKNDALYFYVMSIDDDSKIYLDENENAFVYTYPERLKNYTGLNQLEFGILERLGECKESNRAIATTLIPSLDCDREDIPCLQSLQALIRNDELILSVFFRSNDLYGAWVSNMMFLTNIGLKFVEELKKYKYPNLVFGGIDYHSSSLHIYKTDLEFAKEVIK